MFVNIE